MLEEDILEGGQARDQGSRKAVIDIGSNSVRLVIYDGSAVMPVSYFNEKVFCSIGKSLATTGELDIAGVQRAIVALERFRGVIAASRVNDLQAVATAAVRDAKNGNAFVHHAEAALGAQIRVLGGEDEARVSALGVLSGIPDAEGLVCDLGGGSLEIAHVSGCRVGNGISLPVGPLRLIDATAGSVKLARREVDLELGRARNFVKSGPKTLYLVGGAWRNIARVHMEHTDYPLKMLHQYTMNRQTVLDLTRTIAQQSRKSLEQIASVSKRRAEAMPFAAVILERLVLASGAERVLVSAHGLREGLLAEMQGRDLRQIDPLLEATQTTCNRLARDPVLCGELIDWTKPLFPWEPAEERRLREAACWLSDTVWRTHPDYRGEMIFNYVLGTQFAGLDHPGRCFLAVALHERYPDGPVSDQVASLRRVLSEDQIHRSKVLGLALRLGVTLAGASSGVLPQTRLTLDEDEVTLEIPRQQRNLFGENSDKRFANLAQALGREPKQKTI